MTWKEWYVIDINVFLLNETFLNPSYMYKNKMEETSYEKIFYTRRLTD
jgi:hypothetical protein